MSSAEVLYGVPLVLPGELVTSPEAGPRAVLDNLRHASPLPLPTRPLTYSEAVSRPLQQLQASSFVFVQRGEFNVGPLSPLYVGPYRVTSKGPKVFILDIGGRSEAVSVDRLKPYLGEPDVKPAVPPQMGRPRGQPGVSAPQPPASTLGGLPVEDG